MTLLYPGAAYTENDLLAQGVVLCECHESYADPMVNGFLKLGSGVSSWSDARTQTWLLCLLPLSLRRLPTC